MLFGIWRWSALAGLAMTAGASAVQAQDGLADSLIFDIVVRDFKPTHSDFETFEVGNPNSSCTRDPNQSAITAKFPTLTGLKRTEGMVRTKLDKDGKPVKVDGRCASNNLDQWFKDIPGTNYSVEMPLVLRRIPGTNQYSLNERYGGKSSTGYTGFFPLDTLHGSTVKKNWGKQNTASWCSINEITQDPSKPNVQTYLDCQARSRNFAQSGSGLYIFENSNFVKSKSTVTVMPGTSPLYVGVVDNPSAIMGDTIFADASGQLRRYSAMHNYNFTVEGNAIIQYSGNPGEKFFFGGDDDLWVFIDDSLVVDIGGIHAKDSVDFDITLHGQKLGWKPGSYHTLKFFQAERQSDGSNFIMRASFAPPVSKFAALTVQAAQTPGVGTKKEIFAYLNAAIHPDDLAAINAGRIKNPFIVKTNADVVRAFNPTSVELVPFDASTPLEERALGNKYKMTFASEAERPISTDSLSVNDSATVGTAIYAIRNANGTPTNRKIFKKFDGIKGTIVNAIADVNQAVNKDAFVHVAEISNQLQGNPGNSSLTGEVILSSLGFADTSKTGVYFYEQNDPNSKYQTNIKSGVSSDVRWCNMNSANAAISNCLILPHLEASGPFQFRASIFDQSGQFVNDFTAKITAEMILQAQKKGRSTKVLNGKEAVENSALVANFALYPVDSKGRLLGSGVYMVKWDAIWENYTPATFGDATGTSISEVSQTANRLSKFVKVGYVRPQN